MISQKLLDILLCSDCGGRLIIKGKNLLCTKCRREYGVQKNTIDMVPIESPVQNFSKSKWEQLYNLQLNDNYTESYNYYMKHFYKDTFRQLDGVKKIDNIVYLELGCGKLFFGTAIANKCKLIIGIDMSSSALKIAETMLEKKGIKNYLLIKGDILSLPLRNNTIDLIYGGGVIEHFRNTQRAVDENYRVLTKGGVAFNTVPYLNISSLTYRQRWGNIPNVDVLRPIFEFLHIKILHGRHMVFGYEMSFTKNKIIRIHKTAGYSKIAVDKFDVELFLDSQLPLPIKKALIFLANSSSLFCPMMKVVGYKL